MLLVTCPLVHGLIEPTWRDRIRSSLSLGSKFIRGFSLDIVDGDGVDLGLLLHAVPVAAGVGDKEKKAWETPPATSGKDKTSEQAMVAVLRGSLRGGKESDTTLPVKPEFNATGPGTYAQDGLDEWHSPSFVSAFTDWLRRRNIPLTKEDQREIRGDLHPRSIEGRDRLRMFEKLLASQTVAETLDELGQFDDNRKHLTAILELFQKETSRTS